LVNTGHGGSADVAIIGMGCRFPGGASSPGQLWQLLEAGTDATGDIPDDRWNVDRYYFPRVPRPGRMNARRGGFLERADLFDADFFGIPQRVANQMDPQQRLLMEVCWEALENAGLPPDSLAGSKTGVFIGASSLNYAEIQTSPGEIEGLAAHSATGMYMSILSNRLSYQFDLHGPSVTVDTACSSSLVATHLACQSLRWGESDLALAGGVNLILTPQGGVALSQAGMLAPDGRSRPFDAAASGYARGEGAGVVVLRPLAVAIARRDRIYAVISGTAVNQDGRTQGITLPNGTAQLMNVRAALADASIPAREVGYVEAHGTGTPVGDPVEAAALGAAFAEGRPAGQPFLVGSVKANIGHLEAAAGVAGLIKAALAIRHRRIPASLNFDSPSPAIDFSRWQMMVPTEGCAWPGGYRHAVASVNSFGFGGTNANVVLSESPAGRAGGDTAGEQAGQAGQPAVLALSARSDEALRRLAASYATLLQEDPPGLEQLAANLVLRRAHHDRRLALVASSAAEAAAALDHFAAGNEAASGLHTGGGPAQRRLAFVFNGQGPQWFAMGRSLLNDSAVFSAKVAECDELALPHLGWSIREALAAPDAASSPVHQTQCLQPMMFTLQVALVELWKSWGIQPAGVIGHSMGEIAAAHTCGALDLATALKIISLRARIQDAADSSGAMMFVALGSQQAAKLCDRYPGQVWLSALNSPGASTLSGRRAALRDLAAELEASGVFARMLRVNCACHSPDMDPLKAELITALGGISGDAATLPMYSTVTAELIDGKELRTEYWWRNFREPVRFEPACRAMLADGFDAFVEITPHPVLSSAVKEIAAAAGVQAVVLATLHRDKDGWETFGGAFAALYAAGGQVAWETRYPGPVPALDLPGNPWIQQPCWIESETSRQYRSGGQRHPMLKRIDATRPTWEIKWDDHRLTWVYQHDVLQSVLVPGAAYVEAALAAGTELTGQDCALEFVEFERACVLHADAPMVTRIELNAEDGTFEVHSRSVHGAAWLRNARGRYYSAAAGDASEPPADLDALRRRCPREFTAADVYGSMRQNGYAYGPAFSGISKLLVGQGEALALVRAPRQMASSADDYLFHPALMDACFQAAILPPTDPAAPALLPLTCLPVGIDTARLRGHPGAVLWCHTCIRSLTADGLIADARVYDEHGNLAAEFTGLRARAVQRPSDSAADRIDQHFYRLAWQRDQAAMPSGQPTAVTTSPLDLRAALDCRGRHLAGRLARLAYTSGYQDELRQLCAAYITACLQCLGCDMEPGTVFGAADLSDVLPRYRRALAAQLRMLADDGVLAPVGDSYRVQIRAERDTARLWAAALAGHPGCVWELMLLRRTGERLSDVLTGQADPLELLFPGGTADEAGPIYETSPASRFYNLLAQQAVQLLAASADPARTLRVLEVGGGTGGLTASLLPVLPADRCHYLFTDISAAFTSAARERFASYEFLDCRTLDMEREPEDQGLAPGSFDLVVASDAIHATSDLKKTLLSLQDLLAPGGILLMIEAEPGSRWLDLTFGLTEGWWLFRDLQLRPRGPLLTGPVWQELLSSCGYRDVVALSDPDREGSGRQTLLLAAAPGQAQAQASAAADPASAGDWLILSGQDGLGASLARRIRQHGGRPVEIGHVAASARAGGGTTENAASYDSLVALQDLRGIVYLWDAEPAGLGGGAQIEELAEVSLAQLAAILQALQRRNSSAWPRLYLLTRGAHAFRNDDIRLAGAPAWGLGLTIGLEFPQARCKVVDLEAMPAPGEADAVWLELARDDDHGEIVLRRGERFTRRLLSLGASEVHAPVAAVDLPGGHGFVLRKDAPGALDRLRYRAVQRQPPGRGQVTIRVMSASLNFLDVMTATGQVPPLESVPGQGLGADCAGVITEVGDGVGDLAPGDAVVAISSAQGTVSSHLTVSRTSVAAKPAALSFEEAATLPVAFLTASIALRQLARLQPGERVLIHSAAGGTGVAAIQIARLIGAEIFATAGDSRKRAFLRGLGVTHVMDSRSVGFADEIQSLTGGRGVDVVLSAVTGELLTRSIGCLAPYGRFVDIGKRDLIEDRRLGLRPFLNNLAYFSFDLRQMIVDQPGRVHHELTDLLSLFQDRQLRPLPFRVYPAAQAVTALKHLAAARHLGKLVIAMDDDQGVKVETAPAAGGDQIRGTWLITGGLGGVGLAMASALADAGASGVVLAGRSGISGAAARAALDDLRARGVETLVAKADVTDRDELAGLIDRISRDLPPLRGVLHCAMVLDDALLTSLDRPRMAQVLAPKVQGAWHLHELTAHLPLDAFILFSSATSVLGAVGQASYAAANAFLDHLAAALRQRGRPAISLNWGAVADTGYIARHPEIADQVAAGGLRSFSARQMFQALRFLRSGSYPQVGVFPMDWPTFFRSRGAGTSTQPRYARLAAAATSVPGGPGGRAAPRDLLARLRGHQGQAQAEVLTQELKAKVASVLGIPSGQLEDGLPLIDYLDSLLAAELTSWINSETSAKITLMELMRGPSISELAVDILRQVSNDGGEDSGSPVSQPGAASPSSAGASSAVT
jgi:acyl transferase domain-containing protein/NADPH:quinone reductase-like Zn-dependent oxidoreductase/NAD(P)-dependent dehydrogenase (short-subunit alcohol dehydrogenase family)